MIVRGHYPLAIKGLLTQFLWCNPSLHNLVKPMSAFIQSSWHHVMRELGFSIQDCCFGVLSASPLIADWNTRTAMVRKHSKRWVRWVYWWPPGEAKSAAWIQLVCLLHIPVPSCPTAWCQVLHTSNTVTCPWLFCGTSGTLFFFFSAALLTWQGTHGNSESSFKRTALCHKARGEWVTNCTQPPPTARLRPLARPQPCELKLNSESLRVYLSSERIIPSQCLLRREVVFNSRKLRAGKLQIMSENENNCWLHSSAFCT